MPTWIRILSGIIQTIAVPVQALGVGGVRHYGIRRNESAHACIIVPCPVIVKPYAIQSLAGKLLVRGHGAGARFTVGVVIHCRAYWVAAGVRHQGGAGKVVLVYVPEVTILFHSYQLVTQIVVAGSIAGGQVYFVIFIDIDNGLAALASFTA